MGVKKVKTGIYHHWVETKSKSGVHDYEARSEKAQDDDAEDRVFQYVFRAGRVFSEHGIDAGDFHKAISTMNSKTPLILREAAIVVKTWGKLTAVLEAEHIRLKYRKKNPGQEDKVLWERQIDFQKKLSALLENADGPNLTLSELNDYNYLFTRSVAYDPGRNRVQDCFVLMLDLVRYGERLFTRPYEPKVIEGQKAKRSKDKAIRKRFGLQRDRRDQERTVRGTYNSLKKRNPHRSRLAIAHEICESLDPPKSVKTILRYINRFK